MALSVKFDARVARLVEVVPPYMLPLVDCKVKADAPPTVVMVPTPLKSLLEISVPPDAALKLTMPPTVVVEPTLSWVALPLKFIVPLIRAVPVYESDGAVILAMTFAGKFKFEKLPAGILMGATVKLPFEA